jgi:hypothetical protein
MDTNLFNLTLEAREQVIVLAQKSAIHNHIRVLDTPEFSYHAWSSMEMGYGLHP